jgi:hypothetical protein
MPKTSKTKPKIQPKNKRKNKPEPISITSRKEYWIVLTLSMVIFGAGYGYLMKVPIPAIVMLLATVISVIVFAFYIKFKPSTLPSTSRATYFFVGASVIGFGIWALVVLSINAAGLWIPIASVIGEEFFAITSLIIFLILGAFIGDWISKNRQRFKFIKS